MTMVPMYLIWLCNTNVIMQIMINKMFVLMSPFRSTQSLLIICAWQHVAVAGTHIPYLRNIFTLSLSGIGIFFFLGNILLHMTQSTLVASEHIGNSMVSYY